MYRAEEKALTLLFGSLSDFVAKTFLVTRPSSSALAVIELDEASKTVSSGPWCRRSEVKAFTVLPSFEDHHDLYEMEVQDTMPVTGGPINLRMN